MSKDMDDIHAKIVRKFHTLCSKAGLTRENKDAIVHGQGVESSADIDTHALIDICNALSKQIDKQNGTPDMDKLRKQVIASIGGWLRETKQTSSIDTIKAIACRATGHDRFNQIPAERLRNIYNTFRNKQADKKAIDKITTVEMLTAEIMAQNIMSNPIRGNA